MDLIYFYKKRVDQISNVDFKMIKSEMSDGVGNVSLQTATDGTREENISGIVEGSELNEEKNESEIKYQ